MNLNFLIRMFGKVLKKVLPEPFINFLNKSIERRRYYSTFKKMQLDTIFSQIYREGTWNPNGKERDFYSGTGSHDLNKVTPYIQAVINFLGSYNEKLDVVDLGCGDFNVGSQLRPYANDYVACDIVEELIKRNRIEFCDYGVEFKVVNMVDDELPDGEIVFIRQVLQHLSNSDILKIIPKLSKYKFLILTEHLPNSSNFTPNKNFVSGPSIRLEQNSGIVITSPPFNLIFKESQEICSVNEVSGRIVTMVYKLK